MTTRATVVLASHFSGRLALQESLQAYRAKSVALAHLPCGKVCGSALPLLSSPRWENENPERCRGSVSASSAMFRVMRDCGRTEILKEEDARASVGTRALFLNITSGGWGRRVAATADAPSPFSFATPWRHHLRQEPDALVALVRICGGGVQQCASLLRLDNHAVPSTSLRMSAPSANTRASTKVRSTRSQPLIEKPASK